MKTTVYLIRHAEAEGNVYRRCHGQYNSLLTPRAYQQLPYLAKRFSDVPLDFVYASDLFRARRTAQAVAEPHNLSVQIYPALREIDMGDWEDVPWAELARYWKEKYILWKTKPWEYAPPHGETPLQAGQRMLNGVKEIVREHEGKTIAVVTHGSAIRGALTIAHGWTPEQMSNIGWGDNTCVARLDFDTPEQITVVYENDASHLPTELSTFSAIGWKDAGSVPESLQLWFRCVDPLEPNDAQLFLQYMQSVSQEGYAVDSDPNELLSAVGRAQRTSPLSATFCCLEDNDKPIGLVYLQTERDDIPATGMIGGFYLEKDYQGRGLRQQMIGQTISVYRRLGKDYIGVFINRDKESVVRFYQNLAFEPVRQENKTAVLLRRKIRIDI